MDAKEVKARNRKEILNLIFRSIVLLGMLVAQFTDQISSLIFLGSFLIYLSINDLRETLSDFAIDHLEVKLLELKLIEKKERINK